MASEQLCMQCGTVAYMKRYMKGSLATEILLWLFFLLPGVIYSIWRHASVYWGCPQCASPNMIPLTSPVAKKFLADTKPGQPVEAYRPTTQSSSKGLSWGAIALVVLGVLTLGSIIRVATVANDSNTSAVSATAPTATNYETQAIEVCRATAIEKQKNLATWVLKDKYTVLPQTKQDKLDAKNPNLYHVQVVWTPFSADAEIPLVIADCRLARQTDKLALAKFRTFCKPEDCTF